MVFYSRDWSMRSCLRTLVWLVSLISPARNISSTTVYTLKHTQTVDQRTDAMKGSQEVCTSGLKLSTNTKPLWIYQKEWKCFKWPRVDTYSKEAALQAQFLMCLALWHKNQCIYIYIYKNTVYEWEQMCCLFGCINIHLSFIGFTKRCNFGACVELRGHFCVYVFHVRTKWNRGPFNKNSTAVPLANIT